MKQNNKRVSKVRRLVKLDQQEIYKFISGQKEPVSSRQLCDKFSCKQSTAASSMMYLEQRGFLIKINEISGKRKRIFYKTSNITPVFDNYLDTHKEMKLKAVDFLKGKAVKYTAKDLDLLVGFNTGRSAVSTMQALYNQGLVNRRVINEKSATVAYYWIGEEPENKYKEFTRKKVSQYSYGRPDCEEFKDLATRAPVRNIFNHAMGLAL